MCLIYSVLFICLQGISAKIHNNHGNRLDRKLHAISQWLDGRSDSTIYDYIYHVNDGAGLNLFEGDITGYHRNRHHSAHGGCDRSAEDAYSSMAPDPAFAFVEGPCCPTLDFTRAAIRNSSALWNTRIVPYAFDPLFKVEDKQDVMAAIDDFHNKTCLRFIQRTTQRDFIVFQQQNGCSSSIGRQGGPQHVSLASECLKKGTAIHEIMHAVGFFHEQSRPDRDSWVRVIWSNIEKDKGQNFERMSALVVDTLGLSYDYSSVMHYSKTAFTKNGNPTLLPIRDTNAVIGQRQGFSQLDIDKVNTLYRCGDIAPASPTPHAAPVHKPSSFLNALTNLQTTLCNSNGWLSWSKWSRCDLNCQQQRQRFCRPECSDLSDCPGSSKEVQNCPNACRRAYYVGCWRVDPSNLTISSVGDFHGYDQLETVRKCADVAATNGFSVFAMFNNTECLTDGDAYRTFSLMGLSRNCGVSSMGTTDAISVYTYEKHMDGRWGDWGAWQQCDRSCGGGRQYRYRLCNSPPPVGDGALCQGDDQEHRECNKRTCVENPLCGKRFYTSESGEGGIINLNDYNNSMECNYEIETSSHLTISLLITRMDIELSAGCHFDALMVYDGENNSNHTGLMGTHCGNINPYPMISSNNKVQIRFQSDATITGLGFTMYYTINSGQKKTCIEPVPTAHCSVTYTTHFVGDTVTYQCHHGYHFKDSNHPATLRCLDQAAFAVWSDMFPVCVRSFRTSRIKKPTHCDFEGHMCGFNQSRSDDFDWWIEQPKETQHLQKPRLDSKHSTRGNFLYTESMRNGSPEDFADITSKIYTIHRDREQCLSFSYSVYGNDGSTLDVYVKDSITERSSRPLTIVSSRDGHWGKEMVNLYPENQFQIIFRFTMGNGYGSSAALDDVILREGPCHQP